MSKRHRSRRYRNPAPAPGRQPSAAPEAPDGTVVVGRVIRSHGIDGAVRIQPYSDNPARFLAGSPLVIADQPQTVASCHPLPDGYALLRLEGLTRAVAARNLTGHWLFAPIDPAPDLPPGEYYHYQLVGLSVITDQGEPLGAIREVLATGSNDVYVVESEAGDELLLPAITQVVQRIDLESRQVLVHLLDGLR